MSVRSDLAIGQLSVANNGNELLAILDLIAQESEANTNVSDYQELTANYSDVAIADADTLWEQFV